MKYDHAIIYKGKFYRAGEDVPKETVKKAVEAKPVAEPEAPKDDTGNVHSRKGRKPKA